MIDKREDKKLPRRLRILRESLPRLDEETKQSTGVPNRMLQEINADMEESALHDKAREMVARIDKKTMNELLVACKKYEEGKDFLGNLLIGVMKESNVMEWPHTRQAQESFITNVLEKIEELGPLSVSGMASPAKPAFQSQINRRSNDDEPTPPPGKGRLR